jgi:NAD(P)H-hydrate epimerase
MIFPQYEGNIPQISTDQMIEVDRLMIDEYKIDLTQMMENAGRSLAHLARNRFFNGNPHNKDVVILAGTGGNGGGALVCARRLHNYGAKVTIFLTNNGDIFKPVPAHQFEITHRMGISIYQTNAISSINSSDLIIDGIIGYSLKGNPRGGAEKLIHWANSKKTPILALDTPSGLDTSTGKTFNQVIRATATMTLALPKIGLLSDHLRDIVGELYLADISVPPSLYALLSPPIQVGNIFEKSDIVQISGID